MEDHGEPKWFFGKRRPPRALLSIGAAATFAAGVYGLVVREIPWMLGGGPRSLGRSHRSARFVTLQDADAVIVSMGLLTLCVVILLGFAPNTPYRDAAATILAFVALALMFWMPVFV